MSMLLATEAEDGLSDTELTDQAVTFFTAGVETTVNALTSALHLLAHHPEAQQRLWEEAHRVLASGPLSYDRVAELPYAERVPTETLRLYPPIWMVSRQTTIDTELGGQIVPAGTCLLVSPYLLHRRADLFPQPDTFDPDREVGAVGASQGGFVAFGVGTRKCIGEMYARVEAVLLLTTILARWRVPP